MEGNPFKYNDYELLYLYNIGEEMALELLVWKYSFMIKARAYELKVPQYQFDDYVQEGNIMLLKAVSVYDCNSRKSFCNFFDLILVRRFCTLLKKDSKENSCLRDFNFDLIPEQPSTINTFTEQDIDLSGLSDFEKEIYELFFCDGLKIKEIAEMFGMDAKVISNAKQRIIKKIKKKIYAK